MAWQDKIFDFAEDHDMRARMHALVWGTAAADLGHQSAQRSQRHGHVQRRQRIRRAQISPNSTPCTATSRAGRDAERRRAERNPRTDRLLRWRRRRCRPSDSIHRDRRLQRELSHRRSTADASSIWNRLGAARRCRKSTTTWPPRLDAGRGQRPAVPQRIQRAGKSGRRRLRQLVSHQHRSDRECRWRSLRQDGRTASAFQYYSHGGHDAQCDDEGAAESVGARAADHADRIRRQGHATA